MVQLVPNTATLIFELDGEPGTNIEGADQQMQFYVRDTALPWIQAKLDALALYGEQWWLAGKNAGTAMRLSFSNEWRLTRIVARDLGAANGLESERFPNNLGGRAGIAVTPSSAMLHRFAMDPGAFPKVSHMFLGVGIQGDLDGENWELTIRNDVLQRMIDFNVDLNDPLAGGVPSQAQVRVSRSSGTTTRSITVAVPRVTAVTNTLNGQTVRQKVTTQVDRLSTR